MKILITGGASFILSNASERMLQKDAIEREE